MLMYCKLQICCLIIALFVSLIYAVQNRRYRRSRRFTLFDGFLVVGIVSLIFDGVTAVTVNYADVVPLGWNLALHAVFLLSLDGVVFLLFLYVLTWTGLFPESALVRVLIFLPFVANVAVLLAGIPVLDFIEGEISNYSMGLSVYTCFVMVGVYALTAAAVFIRRRRFVEKSVKIKAFGYLALLLTVAIVQSIFPQALITSIAVVGLILGVYLCQEDPALSELTRYHGEMVMGFATLIESRDASTGEHVRRTTAYVGLLVDGLRERGAYSDVFDAEYVHNLMMAAPLHDVGKIAVPDAILQKPGRLTDEEFERIKTHAAAGGKIIEDTFGKTGNAAYCRIAYDVARHHHEKWNGKGYPDGLVGEEIPLCARIMAIADVFDAVSQNRCYRAALPLDECFRIIADGKGKDFEPLLVDIFLAKRSEVEKVHGAFFDRAPSEQPPRKEIKA